MPRTTPDERVDDLLARLRGDPVARAEYVAVFDAERLVGVVSTGALVAAGPCSSVADVMDPNPPTVSPTTDSEPAAWRAVEAGWSTVAVVDERGRFLGLVPSQTLLALVHSEHDEDLARLGGFGGTAAAARSTSLEPVSRRLRHRLPWLVVGLLGALLAAGVVGGFEETLRVNVLVASFLPGVVYLADAVGTQTEALVIRGLSLGVGIRRVVRREALTGALLGAFLGAIALGVVAAIWRDSGVAIAVALAILLASVIATGVAMALPWVFHRLGTDPAFGSGPLATVVQDIITVAVYFQLATWIVR
ncbi:magnesium transporter [Knoellia flava]|uniref:Magnesium transporter n=1 Tax=Knoellia flava TaxID=913969 RepID=A0A8H9FR25_9MICO|nr:magnesium transporter [Knoellia flava]GGB65381.1 magnesium transporter [Knoellia flava]